MTVFKVSFRFNKSDIQMTKIVNILYSFALIKRLACHLGLNDLCLKYIIPKPDEHA